MSRFVALLTLFSLVGLLTLNTMDVERVRWRYLASSPMPASIEITTLASHEPASSHTTIPTSDTSPTPDASPEGDYQLIGVRYWLHPARARVVFDLEPLREGSPEPPAY